MPGDSGPTVVTNARVFYPPRAAAGASGTRHSPLPAWGSAHALHFGAKDFCTPRAYHVAGMLRCISPSLRAKQSNPLLFSLLPHGLLRVARNDGFVEVWLFENRIRFNSPCAPGLPSDAPS